MILTSDRLTVDLKAPGEAYRHTRFDWTTGVQQVRLDGELSFLTRERSDSDDPSAQGWGLAGEFGIKTPVGYQDCKTGDWFPKIGVGVLRRPDRSRYRFYGPYEFEPARFAVQQANDQQVTITAQQAPVRGYGWSLSRRWRVEGPRLELWTTLVNSGSRPFQTEEYIHNFFGWGNVGPGWSLSFPWALHRHRLAKWVDHEHLMKCQGSTLSWHRTPTRDFFLSRPELPAPSRWTLSALGQQVTETAHFPVASCNVWGKGHVVSAELFAQIALRPGQSMNWGRSWDFRTSPQTT